ncbi:gamma-glutamyltranspeptidase/glutathione hydrolase [Hoeflea marina]|uniref:Gamma-glutamyltranspeptidase/glutathione hydrolase n=1 Tax=Hoeflea marina TaxID=274592 RepID=A0A317PGE2_9HYPH|nr:gamma-glutamyltransferase family protein [Hoeflea marina]PWV98202.1 gamma-glutamyltranspeptidase/glutathione hydrolase [Hoeflea marina]
MRRFDLPGRSPVIAENGMAATSHPLASASALQALRAGGTAVDAALAASATLAVVEPQMTGIGGDCFALVAQADGTVHGINGSGRAAGGVDAAWYRDSGFAAIPPHSAHAVTVPGALRAWEALHQRYGRLPFERLFDDAVALAENGYPVAPRVAFDWAREAETLAGDPGAAIHLLPGGRAPVTGERVKMPGLAATLRRIACEGVSAFYEGAIAREIADTVQASGGFLTEADLAASTAEWVTPISTAYGGHQVMEIPPNGQGVVALIMMNLLTLTGAGDLRPGSARRYHLEVEAGRLAYAVRDAMLADPAHMTMSGADLASMDFARTLVGQIDPTRRNPSIQLPQLPGSDTVYLTVADRNGLVISFINSIYGAFGAQIVTPKSAVVLQNRGAGFSLAEGHPNMIAPDKRPMHTIIPAMATKDGKASISFGVMGGAYQPMGHAHVLSNLVDHGMDPQEALDHPRLFWAKGEEVLELEAGIAAGVADDLVALGHSVRPAPTPHGGGQAIVIDHADGFFVAGSDPRKDGLAIGY